MKIIIVTTLLALCDFALGSPDYYQSDLSYDQLGNWNRDFDYKDYKHKDVAKGKKYEGLQRHLPDVT